MSLDPSETGTGHDLIFVPGKLRRGLPDALALAELEFVAEGLAAGVIYDVGGAPCFVPAGGSGFVTGDLYRSGSENLMDAILDLDSRAAGLDREKDFRLVEVKVFPHNLGQRPVWARTWEWTGEQDGRKLRHGDWVDWASPRAAPWCTWIAVVCLLNGIGIGFAAACGLVVITTSILGIALSSLVLLSAPAGLVALWLGSKRRERHREFRRVLFPISVLLSIPALMGLLSLGSLLFD